MSNFDVSVYRDLYDRIQETAKVQTFRIGTKDYATEKLNLVEDPRYYPSSFRVNSLKGLLSIVSTEITSIPSRKIIVSVDDESCVKVYTTYDDRYNRTELYSAYSDTPCMDFGHYMSHEEFMIKLRSRFIRNEDIDYLLKLLASIVDEDSVKSSDNGLTQKVEAQKGITTVEDVEIKPIVKLAPYRTFLEVEQPESEFLVRLREGGQIALFEADGGMWKLTAKERIAQYLKSNFNDLLSTDNFDSIKEVIIME